MQDSSDQGSSSNHPGQVSVTVSGDEGFVRLDRLLAARLPGRSRPRLNALVQGGQVKIGPAAVRDPAYHVTPGETIIIDLPEPVEAEPKAETIALKIVYEDGDIIVIDKPSGLVVHPAAGHATGTLVN